MIVRVHKDSDEEVSLEDLSWLNLRRVELPDLMRIDAADLLRAHRHVKRQVGRANGLDRMAIGVRVLTPIEVELRCRHIPARLWSPIDRLRSDLELVLRQQGECTDAVRRDQIERDEARLRRKLATAVRDEARERHRRGPRPSRWARRRG
jgi:hypothetical protein